LKTSNDTSPSLTNSRLDLIGGQAEAIGTAVTELNGVRVLGLSNTLDVVETVTSGSIQSAARVTSGVRLSRVAADGVADSGANGLEGGLLRGDEAAVVTIS
jgi:hypothetical protein